MTQRLLRLPGVAAIVATAGILLLTQVLLPGQAGGGRGTPAAVLFGALVAGLLNALTAVGLVLLYRTTRIINFAQTAIGAAGGELVFQLLQLTDVPFAVAFVLGLLLACVVGLAFELAVVRRFFAAPRLVLTIATIAAAAVLASLSSRLIQQLPFLPKSDSLDEQLGLAALRDDLPFRGFEFTVGGLGIRYGFAEVFAIAVAVLVITGVGCFIRYTRMGVAVRALAENVERATLLGIGTGVVSATVWTMAGLLSGAGVILTGLLSTPSAARGTAPDILLPALAAAVLARMERIPTAVVGSVLIAVVAEATTFSFRDHAPLVDLGLFLVVAGGLLAQRRRGDRSETGGGVTWEASKEQRAMPRELAVLPGIRLARYSALASAMLAVVLYPLLATTSATVLGSVIALNGVVALSVLVLTGWGGQVSLGQYGLVAVGAVLGGAITSSLSIPFWFAVPFAALLTGAVAALLGVPALRIRGLFLAVTTFAFAIAVRNVLLEPRYFGWLLPDALDRPSLFILDFDDERNMYYLCVAFLVIAVALVLNLRRSRFGRVLIAVRENDNNLESLGVSAMRIKLLGFAVSGALAGGAGAVFAFLQRGIPADSFTPQRSVDLFLLAVLGGVSSVGGVLIGTLYFFSTSYFFTGDGFFAVVFQVVQPVAVLVLLFIEPTGLIGLLNRVRDSVLRIVVQRRRMVVPSLFADYDERDPAHRLIAVAEPIAGTGLAALREHTRYALRSHLYIGPGRHAVVPERTRTTDSAALATAVAAAEEPSAEPAGSPA